MDHFDNATKSQQYFLPVFFIFKQHLHTGMYINKYTLFAV